MWGYPPQRVFFSFFGTFFLFFFVAKKEKKESTAVRDVIVSHHAPWQHAACTHTAKQNTHRVSHNTNTRARSAVPRLTQRGAWGDTPPTTTIQLSVYMPCLGHSLSPHPHGNSPSYLNFGHLLLSFCIFVAFLKTLPQLVILLTFQPLRSWLKAAASLNMSHIFVTLVVSQLVMP